VVETKKHCGIYTNIAPLYTQPLWDELITSEYIDYTFYSSKYGFNGIPSIDFNESCFISNNGKYKWRFLKNVYLGRLLIFQYGHLINILRSKHDVYILNGEMHNLSNWIAILVCKLRKKPVLFWGHGMYGDESFLKKWLRRWFNGIADFHMIYGKRASRLLVESGINPNRVVTVYNSLDFSNHSNLYLNRDLEMLRKIKKTLFRDHHQYPVIIFIGRLTSEKKVSLLLHAIDLCRKRGNLYNCLIVGQGPQLKKLKLLSVSLGINDMICFYGSCFDDKVSSNLIMLADCCVSPGNVGLTAIHSMSFGTPVITHGNMFHQGPEIEAVIPDVTGLFFEEDSITSLADCIDELIQNHKKISMEHECIRIVKEYWNPNNQKELFEKVVLRSLNENILQDQK
jgi:glycosyltransferase involved in cell wall biosynthesis